MVHAAELSPEDEDVFAAWLADKDRPKAMHSAKGPVEALAERGWEVAGLTCDTELASYLLHPDPVSYTHLTLPTM